MNCWCSQPSENNALWRIYGGSEGGVALRTRYKRLAQILPDEDDIGLVKYLDYSRDTLSPDNLLRPGMHKRIVFEYEHEVRILRLQYGLLKDDRLETPPGLKAPIDLEAAIEAIVISPYAPSWARDSIAALVEQLGLNVQVVESTMRALPVSDRMINPKPRKTD